MTVPKLVPPNGGIPPITVTKRCSCGQHYSAEAWQTLPFAGNQTFDDGEVLELRHCTACRSTLAVQVVAPNPAVQRDYHAKEEN